MRDAIDDLLSRGIGRNRRASRVASAVMGRKGKLIESIDRKLETRYDVGVIYHQRHPGRVIGTIAAK